MAPPAYNKYKDRKELKTREIKKSLVHKARLRKNYFKLLDKEGETVPEKRSSAKTQEHERKPQLTYQDKIRTNKERKLEHKREILEKQKEKLKRIEESNTKREKRKENFNKKTKTGQPLMGPRISDLLSKIKESEN